MFGNYKPVILSLLCMFFVACTPTGGAEIEVERGVNEVVEPIAEEMNEEMLTSQPTSTIAPSPTFIPTPTVPSTNPPPSQIVYIQDGNLKVFYPEEDKTDMLYESGDVSVVTIREDGQKVAFVRRILVDSPEEYGPLPFEQASLWVLDTQEKTAKEVLSQETLITLFDGNEMGDFAPDNLVWIAETDYLLFSQVTYAGVAEGMSHGRWRGVYRVNVETQESDVLSLDAERFVLSPDGSQIAVLLGSSMGFMKSDGSDWRPEQVTHAQTDTYFGVTTYGVWETSGESFVLATLAEEIDWSVADWPVDWQIWRVFPNGRSPQLLATLEKAVPNSIVFSPNGDRLVYKQYTGETTDVVDQFLTLDADLGALKTSQTVYTDKRQTVGWQFDGSVVGFAQDDPYSLIQLCPNATQIDDVCHQILELDSSQVERVFSLGLVETGAFLIVTIAGDWPGIQTMWLGSDAGELYPLIADLTWWSDWYYYRSMPFDVYVKE